MLTRRACLSDAERRGLQLLDRSSGSHRSLRRNLWSALSTIGANRSYEAEGAADVAVLEWGGPGSGGTQVAGEAAPVTREAGLLEARSPARAQLSTHCYRGEGVNVAPIANRHSAWENNLSLQPTWACSAAPQVYPSPPSSSKLALQQAVPLHYSCIWFTSLSVYFSKRCETPKLSWGDGEAPH